MDLPQELVDHVIDFLHDDPRTLAQASLVSRARLGRARLYLCESLKVTLSKLISSDPSYLPPLCGYVKTIHFTWPEASTNPPAVLDCFEQSEPHTLALYSCELHKLDGQTIRRSFAKFPCASITTLELREISTTHRTLLILLSLFPSVDNLTISPNRWWEHGPPGLQEHNGDELQHISSPRLRGSFKFFDPPGLGRWGFDRGKLLCTLATLLLQFQTVSLDVKEQCAGEVSIFLNSCTGAVRKVNVGPSYRKSRPCIPSAVPCTQCPNV
jgi:hypothetical protein